MLGPLVDLKCFFFYKVSEEHSMEKPAPKIVKMEGQNKKPNLNDKPILNLKKISSLEIKNNLKI